MYPPSPASAISSVALVTPTLGPVWLYAMNALKVFSTPPMHSPSFQNNLDISLELINLLSGLILFDHLELGCLGFKAGRWTHLSDRHRARLHSLKTLVFGCLCLDLPLLCARKIFVTSYIQGSGRYGLFGVSHIYTQLAIQVERQKSLAWFGGDFLFYEG